MLLHIQKQYEMKLGNQCNESCIYPLICQTSPSNCYLFYIRNCKHWKFSAILKITEYLEHSIMQSYINIDLCESSILQY